jgi:hypothetical protein
MIPIKIQCGCGQRYAFDIDDGVGQMPSAVTCTVCGADGTGAANEIIARSIQPRTSVASTPGSGVRLQATTRATSDHPVASAPSAPIVATRGAAPGVGPIDCTQFKVEARAKIFWGDPIDDVIKYLMMQGFGPEEASDLRLDGGIKRLATGQVGKIFRDVGCFCRRGAADHSTLINSGQE